jgi:hypothetical protein
MSRHWGTRFALTISAVLAACNAAGAAEWTVAKLSGHVVIQSGPVQTVALTDGMVLKSGSVLVANASGRALLVHGGDQMIVSPNSIVAVPKDGATMTTVLQRLGQVELDVTHQSTPHFTVETPFLAAVVKGTHFTVRVFRRGASVTVERGRVEADDLVTGEKVDVLPGQTALVKPGEHLMISGSGVLSPIRQGTPRANPFSSGGAGSGVTASVGGGGLSAGVGVGGVSANVGSAASVSAGMGGVSASLGGGAVSVGVGGGGIGASVGNVASANAGAGGVGVSLGGGAISVGLGGSGAQVSVGGISLGGGGRRH